MQWEKIKIKFNQENHKFNTCIAVAHYQHKEEPAAITTQKSGIADTLKAQLVHLRMAN
jgi:hypothetical protein